MAARPPLERRTWPRRVFLIVVCTVAPLLCCAQALRAPGCLGYGRTPKTVSDRPRKQLTGVHRPPPCDRARGRRPGTAALPGKAAASPRRRLAGASGREQHWTFGRHAQRPRCRARGSDRRRRFAQRRGLDAEQTPCRLGRPLLVRLSECQPRRRHDEREGRITRPDQHLVWLEHPKRVQPRRRRRARRLPAARDQLDTNTRLPRRAPGS